MKKAVLYLIDSGVDAAGPKVTQVAFECNPEKRTIDFYPYADGAAHDHGNRIYRIIRENIYRNIKTYSIRILDAGLKAHYLQLSCALEWIIGKGQRGIINLSLGVMNNQYRDELQALFREALKKRIFAVCAASREPSLPVLLDEVIRVADGRMFREDRYTPGHQSVIDYVVNIDQQRYPYIPESAPSYAAPFVTARALELMRREDIPGIPVLKSRLDQYFARWM